ncbi:unnamed protein product [Penicillium olsonii]|nr:unnamed protein product [Penicillium olsonii]CAG7928676.1 unnamed protein product [Penicillium olsonii]
MLITYAFISSGNGVKHFSFFFFFPTQLTVMDARMGLVRYPISDKVALRHTQPWKAIDTQYLSTSNSKMAVSNIYHFSHPYPSRYTRDPI